MSNPENPPAFPNVEPRDPQFSSTQPGMTLRDWFAGQALAGIIGCANTKVSASHDQLAAYSYEAADAMLAAREQKA